MSEKNNVKTPGKSHDRNMSRQYLFLDQVVGKQGSGGAFVYGAGGQQGDAHGHHDQREREGAGPRARHSNHSQRVHSTKAV